MRLPPFAAARFSLTLGLVQIVSGVSLFAGPYLTTADLRPFSGAIQVLLGLTLTGAAVLMVSQLRYALPRRLQTAAFLLSGAGLFTLAALSLYNGAWAGALWSSLLGLASLALALARAAEVDWESAEPARPDLAALVFGLSLGLTGLGMLLLPSLWTSPQYALLHGHLEMVGLLALLGGAALIAPGRDGAWCRPNFWLRRAAAAVFPAVMSVTSLLTGRWSAMILTAVTIAILLAWESVPAGLARMRLARRTSALEAADTLPFLERWLEVWTWLLIPGAFMLDPTASPQPALLLRLSGVTVVAVAVYIVTAYWLLAGVGSYPRRVWLHLCVLLTAAGFLMILDHGVGFSLWLAGIPALAGRDLGPTDGRRTLMLVLGVVLTSGLMEQFLSSAPSWDRFLAEALIVGLAGWAGLHGALIFHQMQADRRTARRELERLVAILEATPDLVAIADAEQRTVYVNRAGREIMGYGPDEDLTAIHALDRYPLEDWPRLQAVWQTVRESGVWSGENRLLTREGAEVPVSQVFLCHRTPDGAADYFSTIARDISERKRYERDLAALAYHDPLTGLFNRRRFMEELDREVKHARRYQRALTVLYLDLDGLKATNDQFGHACGDALIQDVAELIRSTIRETDIAGRLGGDEFVVLLPGTGLADSAQVAQRLIQLAREHPAAPSFSIGIASFPDQGVSPDQLLAAADSAMYQSKQQGGGRWQAGD